MARFQLWTGGVLATRGVCECDEGAEHDVAGVFGEFVDVGGGEIVGWDRWEDCR